MTLMVRLLPPKGMRNVKYNFERVDDGGILVKCDGQAESLLKSGWTLAPDQPDAEMWLTGKDKTNDNACCCG